MDYQALVEKTKKELEKQRDPKATLTKLYNNAKDRYNQSHQKAKEALDKSYTEKQNAAHANQMLEDKNTDEFMASRGLVFSGESAQAKLNSNLQLNNALSDLASDHAEGLSRLESDKQDYLADLETEYEQSKMKADEDLYDEAVKMTDAQLKQNGNTENGFNPSVSASQMAKEIVKRFGTDGKVSTPRQNLEIHSYVKGLKEAYDLSDDYMQDLLFALTGKGYTAVKEGPIDLAALVSEAQSNYYNDYIDAFNYWGKFAETSAKRQQLAKQMARYKRLDYVYSRCTSLDEFTAACDAMDYEADEVRAYVNELKNRPEDERPIMGENVE